MKTILVNDKEFTKFIDREEIEAAVTKIGSQIRSDLSGKNPLFIGILNGVFVFASDLLRKFEFDCEISFVKLSSYQGMKSAQKIREVIGLDKNLDRRTVVILEDIIDTGTTIAFAKKKFLEMGAEEVKVATLLFKPDSFKENYKIDYIGMQIPDKFIVGYGLDYDGYGRNYPDIYQLI